MKASRALKDRSPFARGFLSVGFVPLAVGAVAAVLVLVVLQWVATSGVLTRLPERHFLLWAHDNNTHVVWRVRELQRQPPTGTPVYLLGGSGLRECIISEPSLTAQVRADGGGADAQVVQLAGYNRTFAEDLAVVDNLPARPGLVVIGINLKRFWNPPELAARQVGGTPLLLPSPSLRRYLGDDAGLPPRQLGILPGALRFGLHYLNWYRETLLRLHLPSVKYEPHVYTLDRRKGLAVNSRDSKLREREMGPTYDANHDYNARMLDYLVGRAQARGHQVLLLDLPRNKEATGTLWDPRIARYQKAVRAIAAKRGVRFVDLNGEVDLRDSDFADIVHLVAPGRAIWQPPMAREIARTLREGR